MVTVFVVSKWMRRVISSCPFVAMEKKEEQEAQGQQQLQEGERKPKTHGVIACSHIWISEAKKFELRQPRRDLAPGLQEAE